jgi:hypothetical protein
MKKCRNVFIYIYIYMYICMYVCMYEPVIIKDDVIIYRHDMNLLHLLDYKCFVNQRYMSFYYFMVISSERTLHYRPKRDNTEHTD